MRLSVENRKCMCKIKKQNKLKLNGLKEKLYANAGEDIIVGD